MIPPTPRPGRGTHPAQGPLYLQKINYKHEFGAFNDFKYLVNKMLTEKVYETFYSDVFEFQIKVSIISIQLNTSGKKQVG